jgi:hypothetical protein
MSFRQRIPAYKCAANKSCRRPASIPACNCVAENMDSLRCHRRSTAAGYLDVRREECRTDVPPEAYTTDATAGVCRTAAPVEANTKGAPAEAYRTDATEEACTWVCCTGLAEWR